MLNRLVLFSLLTATFVFDVKAETIFTETFEKASLTENAGEVEGEVIWTARGRRGMLGVMPDEEGLKSGNVMKITKGLVYVSFPDVKLEVGDSVSISFRYRFAEKAEDKGFPFRFGLFKDSNGTPADGLAPGYWLMTNPGEDEGKSMIVVEEGTDNSLGGGQDFAALEGDFSSPSGNSEVNKVTFTVERAAEDSVDISAQFNDDSANTRTDPRGKVTQFNAFAISLATMANTQFLVDDVVLSVSRKGK
jgi:hypothetical protein